MPLVRRHAVPPASFHTIPAHSAAVLVHEAEVVLPAGVSLFVNQGTVRRDPLDGDEKGVFRRVGSRLLAASTRAEIDLFILYKLSHRGGGPTGA